MAFLHSALALGVAAISLLLVALAWLAWKRARPRVGWARGGVVAGLVMLSAYGLLTSWRLTQFQALMDAIGKPVPDSERAEPMTASPSSIAR